MKRYGKIFLTLCMALGSVCVSAQATIESLREDIRKAEEEIRIHTELLSKVRKDQQVSQSQLKIIQGQIRKRQDMVTSLGRQINLLGEDITTKTKNVRMLESDLEKLKAEYAGMVRSAYENYKMNNFLLFLFASEDFNDATRRVEFMRRYNRMREQKAVEIDLLTDSISEQLKELDSRRTELESSRKTRSGEISTLGKEETEYKSSVTKLKNEESKIGKELKAKHEVIEKAQRRIQEMVAEETNKARGEVRTEAQERYITELSGRFGDNMGKLPYPVSRGVIIDRYGQHAHPTQPGLKVNNKGVNITGGQGAEVVCVFDGDVTKVFSLPGFNNCVMVRHGNYITLYANMASVSVKTGDKVSLNQRLGKLSSSDNEDDNFLHFEIWRETDNLNPEQWLRR